MTTVTSRRRISERTARAAMLGMLALAAALCSAPEARAQWTTSGNNINSTNTGNVGVGTATPTGKLDVADTSTNGVAGRFVQSNPSASNGVVIQTQTASANDVSLLVTSNAGATVGLSVRNTGNVGVGTTAPEGTLHVQSPDTAVVKSVTTGSAATGRSAFQMYRGTAANSYGWDLGYNVDLSSENFTLREFTNGVGATRLTVGKGTGYVGIGTTSPATKLDVADSRHNGSVARFIQSNASASNGVFIQTQTASEHDLALAVMSNGGATAGLAVRNSGNVGVGTASPLSKLHVVGDIRVDGNISAKYQDVAEWVPSRQKLSAGTVVILDPEHNNHVLASTASYDTAVAGVISEKPGLALGETGEGKALVATTGRVKVKVDATRAPVKVGDLLVTSEREGYAMKSEPVLMGGRKFHSPGTIIGKALEPLAGGAGEILVLLSLQ